jgi:hypothetical protein
MKRVLAAAVVFLALAPPLSAHRLDEYLQASRVSLGRTSVVLEVDLTPGAGVADEIVAQIDRDRDKTISPVEAKSYAERVLAEIDVTLDGHAIDMTLIHVEAPSIDEMRHGMGMIQLRGIADVVPASMWRRQRQLHVRNNHHPRSSVYLVNAMIPSDDNITVVAQTRDATQREARIDYTVGPRWPKYVYWPVFGLVVGSWWLVKARAHERLTTIP